jgi:hypothetical protein
MTSRDVGRATAAASDFEIKELGAKQAKPTRGQLDK